MLRWRYECTATATKSGLSNDGAERAYASSVYFHSGDHVSQR
jgi:hypothetical protein